ncbi:glycosyltransferase [Erythrobacter sanguineus]|uniref:UDP-N-acetylglucosamine transferase subunit ALG13 n=1 Tax=Erythrobacter sanguineus TaxID=198312 RepID=A0A1M7SEC8_9SPHN|nr:glycosyltransferase [Erythrobacter sanguineus]MCR9180351.1 glucuronosyltransferase [Erythrobacteraceae bacterium]SHN56841.1 UDP-N-acetylglucosamine transferase subunit ALG13 [Erythrobacter sanguineus]
MIIVTVGMQLGFDRLIKAMDALAPGLGMPIIAQTGKGTYRPRNMDARDKIAPAEFEALVEQSRLIVSHAGIGTVLTAARCARPIILMPRRAGLGEHRNDHQMATVGKLAERPGILVADNESELGQRIAEGLALANWSAAQSPTARQLHGALAAFIENRPL